MKSKIVFVWDFDGVIALTPHEEAWRQASLKYGIQGFDSSFYASYVSGRPRLEGAKNILEKLAPDLLARRGEEILKEFADYKTKIYLDMVSRGEYRVNWKVVEFIQSSRKEGFLQILASASKNVLYIATREKIGESRLSDLFDFDVSGKGASKLEVFKAAFSEALRITSGRISCVVFFD
ncbi:MAG: hypothetical protein ACP5IE_05025, partial [Infirmifilum sp.]